MKDEYGAVSLENQNLLTQEEQLRKDLENLRAYLEEFQSNTKKEISD